MKNTQFMHKYITSETNLLNKIITYQKLNITPILDYAIENNTSHAHIAQYRSKKNSLLETFNNHYHSLKLSSIGCCVPSLISILSQAKKHNCKILIDAEDVALQKHIDPLISQMVTSMGFDHTIYTTYQMYRKDSYDKLVNDLNRYRTLGLQHNIKLVRGAYLYKDGGNNLLFKSKRDTDAMYNKAVDLLLKPSMQCETINVIFATHNLDSIAKFSNHTGRQIGHAFLMGMETDAMLASRIAKFVHIPFGPFFSTLPYMFRRLCENNRITDDVMSIMRRQTSTNQTLPVIARSINTGAWSEPKTLSKISQLSTDKEGLARA